MSPGHIKPVARCLRHERDGNAAAVVCYNAIGYNDPTCRFK